ncbi:MAG: hypothetical protein CMJ19_11075 [Phycisphaeraceae bacterium]|nr:hypothetical protein [Phycisphaeraceae bacterium]
MLRFDKTISQLGQLIFICDVPVIPAQAGIQWHSVSTCKFHWTPACAGVTEDGDSFFELLWRLCALSEAGVRL